ncbi:UNVERIFIED_CONTAM: hypothetical protein FKN15_063869 [Acipenser sinensis]
MARGDCNAMLEGSCVYQGGEGLLCRNDSYATLRLQAVLVKAVPSQGLMKQHESLYEYRLISCASEPLCLSASALQHVDNHLHSVPRYIGGASVLFPAQLITPDPVLTPPAPVVTQDVPEPDVSMTEDFDRGLMGKWLPPSGGGGGGTGPGADLWDGPKLRDNL